MDPSRGCFSVKNLFARLSCAPAGSGGISDLGSTGRAAMPDFAPTSRASPGGAAPGRAAGPAGAPVLAEVGGDEPIWRCAGTLRVMSLLRMDVRLGLLDRKT